MFKQQYFTQYSAVFVFLVYRNTETYLIMRGPYYKMLTLA